MTAGHKLAGAAGAVILLHGRGATAEDILGLAEEFDCPNVAWLAPQAPGRAWYPYSFLAPISRNEPWLTSALGIVAQELDDALSAGIPREKIIIAGFSQGACLATEFVARNATRYGGLIAFTGGLIGPPGTKFRYSGTLAGTPAFVGAGDPDAHVPWQRVQDSATVLSNMGADVTLKRYPGIPHTVTAEEIEEARLLIATSLQ
jgi:predicted esterase